MGQAVQKISETENGQRVRFGAGLRRQIGAELDLLGRKKALILSTPQQNTLAMEISDVLQDRAAGVYPRAAMHTPVSVTQDALELLHLSNADCLVSIGGGSTIGLGKALAFRTDLPHVALPTTYAGSEATPILGQTENGLKTTFSDPRILPQTIIYDPELVATLPVDMTVTSGLNALAHAAEALYAPTRTAATIERAVEGIEALVTGLPQVLADPTALEPRRLTQHGAWACGVVLGAGGMGLHHKLCHALGGTFDLPHAQTHAILLPHTIAYNARSARGELAPLTAALKGTSPGQALFDFARELGAPSALADFGLQESDLDRAAQIATEKPYPNPQPVVREEILALLHAAWAGGRPAF